MINLREKRREERKICLAKSIFESVDCKPAPASFPIFFFYFFSLTLKKWSPKPIKGSGFNAKKASKAELLS